jgi:hypothetical protein
LDIIRGFSKPLIEEVIDSSRQIDIIAANHNDSVLRFPNHPGFKHWWEQQSAAQMYLLREDETLTLGMACFYRVQQTADKYELLLRQYEALKGRRDVMKPFAELVTRDYGRGLTVPLRPGAISRAPDDNRRGRPKPVGSAPQEILSRYLTPAEIAKYKDEYLVPPMKNPE